MSASTILVCFAVKEEAAPFRTIAKRTGAEILVTGMGAKNAGKYFRSAIEAKSPRLVITAGFAGALNPQLSVGTVVFDEDDGVGLGPKLLEAGAVKGQFHCAARIATTAAEKWQLWQSTGADAVEMESGIIRAICREKKIPAATVRVISDSAGEDLPLDFNALMTADDRLDFGRLFGALARNPRKIPELIKLRNQTDLAAHNLAEALSKTIYA